MPSGKNPVQRTRSNLYPQEMCMYLCPTVRLTESNRLPLSLLCLASLSLLCEFFLPLSALKVFNFTLMSLMLLYRCPSGPTKNHSQNSNLLTTTKSILHTCLITVCLD